jgi:hypothetical protein
MCGRKERSANEKEKKKKYEPEQKKGGQLPLTFASERGE